ncbi:MAG: hypothetical protein L3J28_14230 [Candidatus Polarisedimenticolaceae bacterium]|nr:hypothetical protein [Candidatus Polarisedimenticolaceae bacterium]
MNKAETKIVQAGPLAPLSSLLPAVFLLLLLFSGTSQAAICIGANCTYTTIQLAIDAATTGQTITVSDGTYNENINFSGKEITVQSENGAATTFIKGTTWYTNAAVVKFITGETAATVLDGFTLDNTTSASETRGITIVNATPTIKNCIIDSNEALYNSPGFGGGMHLSGTGGATITATTISNNTTGTSGEQGGGIYHAGSGLLSITGGSVESNYAYKGGAGIVGTSGSISLSGTAVKLNTSGTGGTTGAGGIYYTGSGTLTITDSIIESNSSPKYGGGGIYISSGTANITGTTIKSNTSSGDWGGAGILMDGTAVLNLSKSHILGNRSSGPNNNSDGGGIRIGVGTSATITNTVLAGNVVEGAWQADGGGIFNAGTLNLYFSTIADNYSYNQGGGLYAGGTENIYNSIIWGNSYAHGTGSAEIYGTTENLYLTEVTSDPLFVSRSAAAASTPTINGSYDLQAGSNAIDTGDATNAPADDIAGITRPQGAAYDKGAYETVAAGTTVCASGCTFTTIQAAIDASTNGDVITVKDGIYPENINFNAKVVTVQSENGAGTTSITGDTSNAPVVTFANSALTSSTLLDGFTVNNSASANTVTHGISITSSAAPTLKNLIIKGNKTFTQASL